MALLKDWTYHLASNIGRCFRRANLLWQILAGVLTYISVMSGFDWWYFEATRNVLFRYAGFPAAVLGFLIPVFVPFAVWLWGIRTKSYAKRILGAALGQAAILGWLLSSFYKFFTGRIQPTLLSTLSPIDISHQFEFGIFNNGIFWGWPSSHTAVAFAMAGALIALYPRKRSISISASLYALYIGLGVSVTVHWFSDFIAGAILGMVLGLVVGASYRTREDFLVRT